MGLLKNGFYRRYDLRLDVFHGTLETALKKLEILRPEIGTLLLGVNEKNGKEIGSWHSLARIGRINHIQFRAGLDNWTYKSVWRFARSLSLPYCKLYDQG